MLQRREEGQGVLRGQETGAGASLTRVVREDLTDKTTSEQRSEKWQSEPHGYLGG